MLNEELLVSLLLDCVLEGRSSRKRKSYAKRIVRDGRKLGLGDRSLTKVLKWLDFTDEERESFGVTKGE